MVFVSATKQSWMCVLKRVKLRSVARWCCAAALGLFCFACFCFSLSSACVVVACGVFVCSCLLVFQPAIAHFFLVSFVSTLSPLNSSWESPPASALGASSATTDASSVGPRRYELVMCEGGNLFVELCLSCRLRLHCGAFLVGNLPTLCCSPACSLCPCCSCRVGRMERSNE